MTTSLARRAAFEILRRVELEGAYASVLLASLDRGMREDDRALCHELVLGVLRRQLWLDQLLKHLANRSLAGVDLPVKLALRLGLYQLRFLSRIPPSAAVDESVKLVRAAGLRSAASFANAVLRRATREPNYDPTARVGDPLERLAIETSHPKWLIRRWANAFGFEEAAALAHADNQPAPVAFRVTAKALKSKDASQIISELETKDARVSPSKIAPEAWRVVGYRTAGGSERVTAGKHGTPAGLPRWGPRDAAGGPQARIPALLRKLSRDGLIYLQDEASQLVAHLLDAQSGDRVLDVCAAPGSKTTHIDALAPQALIVAGDLYEHRLRTLKELAKQQGADGIQIVAYDATRPLPFAESLFDRVLVDAPCSGTGTLRRNPEIRWRIKPADIDELSQKQTQILANASAVVRAGGHLVYSTCSVEPEENEHVVENFLKEHENFRRANLDAPADLRTESGAVRTWPHRQETDGFFVAAFEREG
ncbi:MAG TPA: 16S rRNA (cytosine(967)-C(5))-methyltransferase RsmB [Pyrinomonadaceae bacterium]|nr:16S rRNA (cytosine(967)-C(5))-methyltransferase RsmB [Pyrinomonadaceae bacterium]